MSMIGVAAVVMLGGVNNAAEAHVDRLKQHDCLTEAVYYESRDEPVRGQVAVAWVVLNRVAVNGSDACAEIQKPYQFSYRGYKRHVNDQRRLHIDWEAISLVVGGVLDGKLSDPTKGAQCFYNASLVTPGWAASWMPKQKIGSHTFVHCQAKKGGK